MFIQKPIGLCILVLIKPVIGRIRFYSFQKGLFKFVYVQVYTKLMFNKCVAQHMINVAMGVDELGYPELIVVDKTGQDFLFVVFKTTRINDDARFCFIVQHVSIFLKRVKFKTFYV